MKYLIIGLGNPGEKYENSRHNIGFKVLDRLASLSNISFSTDNLADVAVLKQGSFLYMPINPNTSYYVYTPTGSGNSAANTNDVGYGAGLTGTIIEFAVFK